MCDLYSLLFSISVSLAAPMECMLKDIQTLGTKKTKGDLDRGGKLRLHCKDQPNPS